MMILNIALIITALLAIALGLFLKHRRQAVSTSKRSEAVRRRTHNLFAKVFVNKSRDLDVNPQKVNISCDLGKYNNEPKVIGKMTTKGWFTRMYEKYIVRPCLAVKRMVTVRKATKPVATCREPLFANTREAMKNKVKDMVSKVIPKKDKIRDEFDSHLRVREAFENKSATLKHDPEAHADLEREYADILMGEYNYSSEEVDAYFSEVVGNEEMEAYKDLKSDIDRLFPNLEPQTS